ncbi:hypothetical protein CDAR_540871 [Caerostris darwini]|uniref:Uncharacterized protein n=1 Tax=Caerostris darwini TaxID=1538125 RepID=A0AAV4VIW9_9ARAC|nr:hypothetical protein CDAR_540871 [Caerostris darwini]
MYTYIYPYTSPPIQLTTSPFHLHQGREACYSWMALRVPVFVYTDGELDLGSDINGAFIHSIVDAPSGCCRRRKWKREVVFQAQGKRWVRVTSSEPW